MKPKRVALALTIGCVEAENPGKAAELKDRFSVWSKADDDWTLICRHLPEVVEELYLAMKENRHMRGIPGKTPVRIDTVSYLPADVPEEFRNRRILEDRVENGFRILRTKHSEIRIRLRLPEESADTHCLGFQFTPQEVEMRKRAVRLADEFMRTRMSFGRPARMHGEYYVPGCSPKSIEKGIVWLSKESAVEYGRSHGLNIQFALNDGRITRREFSRRGARVIYEYSLDSIHDYMNANGIMTEPYCCDERDSVR
ncbi:MAG: hypothetical protein K2O78_08355 [Muribaculaceae bacterium]|nr:hypothetical protein [Muribaculaceae bacterium]